MRPLQNFKIGDEVWFPNTIGAAKANEYIDGTIVEDNGDKIFIETYDGLTFNVDKRLCTLKVKKV